MQGMQGLYERDDRKQREEAFRQLEKIKKKVPDLDYEKELEQYREEKYDIVTRNPKDFKYSSIECIETEQFCKMLNSN